MFLKESQVSVEENLKFLLDNQKKLLESLLVEVHDNKIVGIIKKAFELLKKFNETSKKTCVILDDEENTLA